MMTLHEIVTAAEHSKSKTQEIILRNFAISLFDLIFLTEKNARPYNRFSALLALFDCR